ncbi:glycoside hydrolase family 32 protein [Halalkalibacter akibai]|uniref:Sucrose-6-phosphate hydrolase n=1 Tax=Halalkalibacter akibai (strain ATCC 43226 / DSM 21942 / CIP 109018 / JCM 9157 / 1139) TaxID=1236973 RepID=W4R200_HALA3|nr:sucrose-6-phosphate hydrolase [Halalkalibacter akibai]GAE37574.1 sucrose-6-phosphate hydrolase [Halalkalibacter akibai JCM 9157]
MSDLDQSLRNRAYKEVEVHKEVVESDQYRLNYHVMPPVGLLNDPNGFIQFNGVYHLFYQWNPFKTDHGAKFWGHYSSTDLVKWKHHDIALTPSDWFDKNGCYSGSAIEHDQKLYVFYTGNVKDKQNNRETYQVMAVSEDGYTFEKKGVVIELPEGYTAHFRDPKVWKHDDTFYLIIGAQSKDLTGKAVLFRSNNLVEWEHLGAIAGAHMGPLGDFGYMWECPDLFELGGQDVMIFSPQGLEPSGIHYQNLYQAGYVLGKLDYNQVQFDHGSFVELDRGFEFYAPQTTIDENGRRILIGWMGMPEEREDAHPTIEHKWVHAMTIPRELKLVDGKLYQRPVEELKRLRNEEVAYSEVELASEPKSFDGIDGTSLEIYFEPLEEMTELVTIRFRENGSISYDPATKQLKLDRVSFVDGQTVEERFCDLEQVKNLRIFLDTSSIELFVNDGEEVFTARIYPDHDQQNITFAAEKNVRVLLKAWKL